MTAEHEGPREPGGGPFILTGYSGSGKTVLSRGLEDIGFHCVDNVPLEVVEAVFTCLEPEIERVAVVLDVRTPGFAERFPEVLRRLRDRFPGLKLVFVEASLEILQHRFSISRRPHPIRSASLTEAIRDETASLAEIRGLADIVIDSSQLEPLELRRQALALGGLIDLRELMVLEIESFSYLHGVPSDASLAFDVRFLPNPYYVPELRPLPGDHPDVVAWLESHPEVGETVARLCDVVLDLAPRYTAELKSRLNVAVGCTGGRHRSVYVADRIARALESSGYTVALHHRDRNRWRPS